jgi:hypothetical protein
VSSRTMWRFRAWSVLVCCRGEWTKRAAASSQKPLTYAFQSARQVAVGFCKLTYLSNKLAFNNISPLTFNVSSAFDDVSPLTFNMSLVLDDRSAEMSLACPSIFPSNSCWNASIALLCEMVVSGPKLVSVRHPGFEGTVGR